MELATLPPHPARLRSRLSSPPAWSLLAWLLVVWNSSPAQAHSRRAIELETRLFAPCCYVQTLDVHESDLADKLRNEIERRLTAGEAPQQIEDELVLRYGERIRAVPRDRDPRTQIPLAVAIALGAGLIGLGLFALRWQRRQRHEHERPREPGNPGDLKYDLELDAALRRADQGDPPPLSG